MAQKPKRVVYSDDDCHRLVDIIINYKNIVECKITDATTWKEKDEVWNKIATEYNSGATVPRTSKPLREKYDNLKKDVRKYNAYCRQELYLTGGGRNKAKIREILRQLYEKIKSIIQLSVYGMEPHPADSDNTAMVPSNNLNKHTGEFSSSSIVVGTANDNLEPTEAETSETVEEEGFNNSFYTQQESPASTPNEESANGSNEQDWSSYTPASLRTKKHPLLQTKKLKALSKKSDAQRMSAQGKIEHELTKAKTELALLRKELLEKESAQSRELHILRLRKEEELYNAKIEGQKLKNDKLKLEIENLKNGSNM